MTYTEIKKLQDEMVANIKKDSRDYVTRLIEGAKKKKEKEKENNKL